MLYRLDTLNRSCLYWAVKNGQYDATRLLVHLGLDAEQKDVKDTSPLELAYILGHDRIYKFLSQKKGKKRVLPEQTNMSICIPDPLYTPPLHVPGTGGEAGAAGAGKGAGSPAIYVHNTTSVAFILIFGLIWFFIWVAARWVPWYAYALALGCGGWMYRVWKKKAEGEGEELLKSLISSQRTRRWIVVSE